MGVPGRTAGDIDAGAPAGQVRHHPGGLGRRGRLLPIASALIAAAVIVLTLLAARYQPLDGGRGLNAENTQFPGMPVGQRPRPVNTFGNLPGELYLPAQRGNLTVTVILRNNGPIAVTIESVSIDPSLALAGKPLYRKALLTPNKLLSATRGPVSGLVLQPGETVVVGLPLHVPACVNRDSTPYVMADSFTVTDRFFGFTHRGAIPLAIPLIWLPAFQAGTPGTVCAR